MSTSSLEAVAVATPPGRKRALGWSFWLSVGWLGVIILGALLAPVLPLPDPNAALGAPPDLGPSIHHLLGTDTIGHDVFSRLVYGARVDLSIGFGSVAIAMVLGGGLGLVAGYYRRKIDLALNFVSLVFLAFPALVLILSLVTFLGHKLWVIILSLGVVGTPLVFQIVRASATSYSQREFVTAARALGAKTSRIILREVMPNVAMTALSFVFIAVGVAIIVEAGLSFLGLSLPPPTASWGDMVNVGASALERDSILWLWPSLALFFTVLSLNVAGEKLRGFLGVKESFL